MNQQTFPDGQTGIGNILGNTFRTYFRNLGSYAVFTLLINGVFVLVFFVLEQLFTVSGTGGVREFADMFAGRFDDFSLFENDLRNAVEWQYFFTVAGELMERTRPAAWVQIISIPATLFVVPLVLGGISVVTTGCFSGESRTPTEWLAKTASKYKTLFTGNFCSSLFLIGVAILSVIALLFATIILGLFTAFLPFLGILLIMAIFVAFVIMALFFSGVYHMSYPVMVLEGLTGFSPILRALRIGRSKFWRTVGTTFTINLVGSLAGIIISAVAGLLTGFRLSSFLFVGALVDKVISLFVSPLLPISLNFNYLSIRGPAPAGAPEVVKNDVENSGPGGPEAL